MLALSYPHIEKSEHQSAHLQRLPRIRIAQIVMDYIAYGWSVEEICRQHLYLTLSEAYAAMGYYFDHQEEIEPVADEYHNRSKHHRTDFALGIIAQQHKERRNEIENHVEEKQESMTQTAKSPFYIRMKAKGLL